jgi:hypothetical protein
LIDELPPLCTSVTLAIEIKQDYALAYNSLGVALHDQKRMDEVIIMLIHSKS